jgi:hypothetical protein
MNRTPSNHTAEHQRLASNRLRQENWQRWGPYLSERQWGTVREDYSANGEAWSDFSHDQARSRAYRWGEDGLLGISDRQCRLCFGIALWNGNDPILKERLYGLTGPEGNHGEDVKELYYYLDATPTCSYAKALYRYPQARFPYEQLLTTNRQRGLHDREFELADTGVFHENRFFDVAAEYAKAAANDILIRITVTNHGPDSQVCHLLPTLWFRNTWVWGCRHEGCSLKPRMAWVEPGHAVTEHETLESFRVQFGQDPNGQIPELLFTENETNFEKLFDTPNFTPYTKDAFHRWLIDGEHDAVNPRQHGTKLAAVYRLEVPSQQSRTIEVRLRLAEQNADDPFGPAFQETFAQRLAEADEFYDAIIPGQASDEERRVSRQAYAGLIWTKQFYHYIVEDWLEGDKDVAAPPPERKWGRNHRWTHLYARDILSMPDKWEYPWFAAWDLAFHMIPMARIDPDFAKHQLLLLLREWYMHPNGQLPAYEFAFYDVNPPVHAWACLRVFQMEAAAGSRDTEFLAKAFQRLLLNFTWWVNRVDVNGDNVFAGGFLGLDNIGVFDRSKGLPAGTRLEQADGTAWMAFYCGTMLSISLELARTDPAYADMASKFLDHFVRIADAINSLDGTGLWDCDDRFYYDHLHLDGQFLALKVRSLVGLLPLIAVEVLDENLVNALPDFRRKLEWFLKYRHDLVRQITLAPENSGKECLLLSIPARDQLESVLRVLLDETEFLSDYGVRSLSKRHEQHPFELKVGNDYHRVAYIAGESDSWMFGGNSNWRGPIWFPLNYLLIECLEKYYAFFGDDLQVECPSNSGRFVNLRQASDELNRRLTRLFLRSGNQGERPCLSQPSYPAGKEDLWQQYILFYEYFHGDTGEGLGASHQTGWTALIANCIEKLHENS